jgi:hypothetical protein
MRNVSDKYLEEIKAHILCSVNFSHNFTVNEKMWKNMGRVDRPQVTIECCTGKIRFACQITKARIRAHTHII